MSGNWFDSRGGCGATLARFGPDAVRKAPRLVLGGEAFAARFGEYFRSLGWDVHTAIDAREARRLVYRKRPHVVLLPVEADDESGYLSCAKLRIGNPKVRVVLVGAERTPEAARFAGFVGAAFAVEATIIDDVTRVVKG